MAEKMKPMAAPELLPTSCMRPEERGIGQLQRRVAQLRNSPMLVARRKWFAVMLLHHVTLSPQAPYNARPTMKTPTNRAEGLAATAMTMYPTTATSMLTAIGMERFWYLSLKCAPTT